MFFTVSSATGAFLFMVSSSMSSNVLKKLVVLMSVALFRADFTLSLMSLAVVEVTSFSGFGVIVFLSIVP